MIRRVRINDWLLSTYPENEISELSIFALVLDTRKTFTKLARWQAFGRVKLSDASIPTAFVRKYYQKIGSMDIEKAKMEEIRLMLGSLPSDKLAERGIQLHDYNKALYNSSPTKKTLEALLIERREKEIQEKFEIDVLRCLEESNPQSMECKLFLESLIKRVEKVYADHGYTVFRSLHDKVEDVVKSK